MKIQQFNCSDSTFVGYQLKFIINDNIKRIGGAGSFYEQVGKSRVYFTWELLE